MIKTYRPPYVQVTLNNLQNSNKAGYKHEQYLQQKYWVHKVRATPDFFSFALKENELFLQGLEMEDIYKSNIDVNLKVSMRFMEMKKL